MQEKEAHFTRCFHSLHAYYSHDDIAIAFCFRMLREIHPADVAFRHRQRSIHLEAWHRHHFSIYQLHTAVMRAIDEKLIM